MAITDPTNPGANNPAATATATQGLPTDPNAPPPASNTPATPAPASTDSSFLSTIGTDLSSFLSSPLGSLTEFGTLAGLGLSQASSQRSENQTLAGTISSQGAPFTQAGAAELSQLEGGPQVGGPLGASINDQTTAASELGQVAKQYGTGNLTAAQNTQVQQYVAQQKAAAASELAAAGITDTQSDQYVSRMQQIDDNAAVLTQQLTQQNTQIAEGALSAVQTTYSNLLNQSLSSAAFGLGAQESAVTLQIQQDTALAGQLQQLFAGIAQGFGNAIGGGANKQSAPGVGGIPVSGQGTSGVSSTKSGGAGPGVGPSTNASDQAIAAANNQTFQSEADQTVASDTSAQDALNQYADQYQLPDITGGTDTSIPGGSDPFSAQGPEQPLPGTDYVSYFADPFGG